MTIDKVTGTQETILAITGRLDTTTAPEFDTVIDALPAEVQNLVLDCKGLEYVSSAGLRIILKAQKQFKAKGSMKLINVNDTIMEVFDITGFADILTIE